MTYLELVNKIMRRMREPVVASVSENSYSLMVGEFVNDAKRAVESAWSWRGLLDTITIPTVGGTISYDLEDVNCTNSGAPPRENARIYVDPETSIPLIRITTDNEETLILKVTESYKFIERQQAQNDNIRDRPEAVYFGINLTAVTGNTNLRLFSVPTPDAVYNINIYLVNPQNDLSADATNLIVPNEPVLQLAYLYTLYERGEEIGEALTLTSTKADQALTDAISFDSSMASQFIFRPD